MSQTPDASWEVANQSHLTAALDELRSALAKRLPLEAQHSGVAEAAPAARSAIEERSIEPQWPPALETLCVIFGLSGFERKILLMCAGVELDTSFASLLSALRGDRYPGAPTFSLALAAFEDAHWSALLPSRPLRHWRLIEVMSGDALTTSALRIDERILHYVAGMRTLDERLRGLVDAAPATGVMLPSELAVAQRVADSLTTRNGHAAWPLVQLCGRVAASRRSVAAAACAAVGLDLNIVAAQAVPRGAAPEIELFIRLWEREAALHGRCLMLECEELPTLEAPGEASLKRLLETMRGPLFLSVRERIKPVEREIRSFDVPRPSANEQVELWRHALGTALPALESEAETLVSHFSLDAGRIQAAVAEVAPDPAPSAAALWDASRSQSRPRLEGLAQRVEPAAAWDDLVLPDKQKKLLAQIAVHVRQRSKVLNGWGFAAKNGRGLGVSALFSGPSGTGKTMAGEALANELKLDLYRIDLSQVISKYIGETEKNLRRVFDAADEGAAILLFDEADALFGKRSEVKDSHDRYANIEVSYLLQRMETYRGLAILTTNRKDALDAAFMRRIRFAVEFPFPEAAQRAQIWQKAFPRQTPTEGLRHRSAGAAERRRRQYPEHRHRRCVSRRRRRGARSHVASPSGRANRVHQDRASAHRVGDRRMGLDLHIEELVLRGFAPRDRHRIAEATRVELSRLLSASARLDRASEFPARLDGGAVPSQGRRQAGDDRQANRARGVSELGPAGRRARARRALRQAKEAAVHEHASRDPSQAGERLYAVGFPGSAAQVRLWGSSPSGGECADCKQKKEGAALRRSSASSAAPGFAPPIVHDVLGSSGQPLDAATRAFMEPRFGHDFSKVRVHADSRAAASARSVNASAYAVGNDIAFESGRYRPDSAPGRQLLAHELTHVLQQKGTTVSPTLRVGGAHDSSEREADAVAARVINGDAPTSVQRTSGLIQRQADELGSPPGVSSEETSPAQSQQASEATSATKATTSESNSPEKPEHCPPPADLACPAGSAPATGASDTLVFPVDSAALDQAKPSSKNWPTAKAEIDAVAASWNSGGSKGSIRVDGYASSEYECGYNWRLSCSRAQAVAKELESPSDGSKGVPAANISLFAHGESDEAGAALAPNRRATVTLPAALPSPSPKPEPEPAPAPTPTHCGPGTSNPFCLPDLPDLNTPCVPFETLEQALSEKSGLRVEVPNTVGSRLSAEKLNQFGTLILQTLLQGSRSPTHPAAS